MTFYSADASDNSLPFYPREYKITGIGEGSLITGLLAFSTSFLLSLAFLPRLARIASVIGLVDIPDKRKVHWGPKPLVGGLGMMMAVAVSCLLFVPLANLRGFYAGLVLLIIVGFLDDFKELQHRAKFVAQILAALFMIYFSYETLNTFGDLISFGAIDFGILAVPVTIFCTAGVINAINMMDGLDGLAGGISLIAFISFSILAYLNGQPELALLSLAFSGSLAGFLRYNRLPARLFMGDAGSLAIGFALAFLSIAITQKKGGIIPPVAPLLILTVPICDTVTLMTARIVKRKSPFSADRKHLHHILLRFGFNRKRTVFYILSISAGLSLIGISGSVLKVPEHHLFLVFVIYATVYSTAAIVNKKLLTAKIKLKKHQPEQFSSDKQIMKVVKILATAARVIRRDKRIIVRVPVSCIFKDKIISGTLLDLSKSGFSALFDNVFSPGDRAAFELNLPGLPAKLSATAEVVWAIGDKSSRKYGFKIVDISKPESEFLKIYLSSPDIRAA